MRYAQMVLYIRSVYENKEPSFPRDSPDATLNVRPTALTRSVFNPRNLRITNPDRMVLTSGIPLPAAVYSIFTWAGFPGAFGNG